MKLIRESLAHFSNSIFVFNRRLVELHLSNNTGFVPSVRYTFQSCLVDKHSAYYRIDFDGENVRIVGIRGRTRDRNKYM